MVLRNNNLNNNFKCSIFFVPVIPGLCPNVPRGWGTLGQSTMGYNFQSSAEIVHRVKSLMYWPCTQRHWWSLRRILNTSVKYLGSKRKVFEKCPGLPRFPLQLSFVTNKHQNLMRLRALYDKVHEASFSQASKVWIRKIKSHVTNKCLFIFKLWNT